VQNAQHEPPLDAPLQSEVASTPAGTLLGRLQVAGEHVGKLFVKYWLLMQVSLVDAPVYPTPQPTVHVPPVPTLLQFDVYNVESGAAYDAQGTATQIGLASVVVRDTEAEDPAAQVICCGDDPFCIV